eukprot:3945221-Alexandrium_andersonii.AAC.1
MTETLWQLRLPRCSAFRMLGAAERCSALRGNESKRPAGLSTSRMGASALTDARPRPLKSCSPNPSWVLKR